MKMASERGIALLMVLLMIATLSAIAVTTQEYWIHAFSRGEAQQQQVKQKWLALSAEDILIRYYSTGFTAEVLRPSLTGRQPPLRLDGNTFNTRVRDLQACFNINALFYDGKNSSSQSNDAQSTDSDVDAANEDDISAACGSEDNNAQATTDSNTSDTTGVSTDKPALTFPQQVFVRLLISTGKEETQAREILTAIETLAQDRRFADITELRLTHAFTPEEWRILAGQLCALPEVKFGININGLNATHRLLLAALLDTSLNEKETEALLSSRPKTGWTTSKALLPLVREKGAEDNFIEAESFLALNSEFFALEIEIQGRQPFSLRSLIQLTDKSFNVWRRQFGISE